MRLSKKRIIVYVLMCMVLCSTTISYGKYVFNHSLVAANLQIDRTKPNGIVSYSENDYTQNDVLVTIDLSEQIQKVEGWILSDDKQILTKTFTNNEQETVKITDLSGNENYIDVNVQNIDRQKPEIEVISIQNSNKNYEEYANNNHNVVARIQIKDIKLQSNNNLELLNIKVGENINQCYKEINIINQNETEITFDINISSIENNGRLKINFPENYIVDFAGNGNEKIEFDLGIEIDNINPKGEYLQNILENGKVEAIIQTDEVIRNIDGWNGNGVRFTKVFPANVSYIIKVFDYAENMSELEVNVTNASYIKLIYAAHNSEIGWTFGLGNYDIAGKEAVIRNINYKIEALAFRIDGKVEKDFVRVNGYVYSYWNTLTDYGKCSSTGYKYKLRGAPNSNYLDYYSMASQNLSTINGQKYIQIGGAGINAVGNTDYNGNNPIPQNAIYDNNNIALYPYGVSELKIDLKSYDELSVVYQILVKGKGWIKTAKNGEKLSYNLKTPMTAIRTAIIPNSEVESLIELWDKDIGTANVN